MTLARLPEIRTVRLTIRAFEERDLPAVFACYDNADVTRFCPPVRWPTMQHAHSWFARTQQRVADGDAMQFVVELAESSTIIGTCVLFKIDVDNKRAEIGYALGRPFWGAGYMHETLHALIGNVFRVLQLHRLEATIDPRNENSLKSIARLGFKHEGTLREYWLVDGQFADSGLYGLLARDWAALNSSDIKP